MSVKKIIFFGTPEFAIPSLEALNKSEHFEILAVVTQPDRPSGRKMKLRPSPVKVYALENNIPVLTPEKMDSDAIEAIKKLKADSVIVIAFGQILPQSFLDLFPEGIVNVHGSLLPKLRGAAPIQRTIINGDYEGGVSLQVMKFKLDSGDIIAERKVKITENMTSLGLHDLLKIKSTELLLEEYIHFLDGKIKPTPQDESKVTYAAKLHKVDSLIDWNLPAQEIHNKIRGFLWGPGTYSYLHGKKLKFHESKISHAEGAPGKILSIEKESFCVGCGKNSIELLVVQPESKPKMKSSDFLRGYVVNIEDEFKAEA